MKRPSWVPAYIPALDGLRGIAVSLVVLYHCHPKLGHTLLGRFAEFGWSGVNLFFVLSGFLITGIIVDSRDDASFFRNFYARRALRIWPVYVLLLLLNYVLVPCFLMLSPSWAWHITKSAPWLYYALFVQNLFALTLPGTIAPTWSLAIEEQFYLAWAPIGRRFQLKHLALVLLAVFIASPIIRAYSGGRLMPTHTLIHLDGLALGSLIAVTLRIGLFEKTIWRGISFAAIGAGLCGIGLMLVRGTALADTLLALGFGGMLVAAILSETKSNLYGDLLRSAPLKFLGTVSYGLYMTHILVFVLIGALDRRMEPYGVMGNYIVVIVRLVLSLGFAAALWYGFETRILRLKKRFAPSQRTSRTTKVEHESVVPDLTPEAASD